MAPDTLATFEHPARAYLLEYPAHWEHLVQEEGRSCGFGPPDRNDVGIWVTLLPFRVDAEALRGDLRHLFEQAVGAGHLTNIREDGSLRHHALRGDGTDPKDGGSSWLVAGGDLLLLATSQFPPAEREAWAGPFDRLMASLRITRDDEAFALKVARALLARLQEQFPGAGFEFDGQRIRGGDQVISPANLIRQVRQAPDRQDALIAHFVAGLAATGDDAPSAERLEAVRDLIVPVLKPAGYVLPQGPTATVVSRPWLGDLIICYAVRGGRTVRFVLQADAARWRIGANALHRMAMANLRHLRWPERLPPPEGSGPGMIVISSRDGLDATRLLHPSLHALIGPVLGTHFLAGVPDRDTLLLFPAGDAAARARIAAQLRQDFTRAPYPISPSLFQVGPNGIALAQPE